MIALLGAALGGTVALHDGSNAQAARRAVARTLGVPLAEVDATTLPQLLAARDTPVVWGAGVLRCAQVGLSTTGTEMAEMAHRAAEHVQWGEYRAAIHVLDAAIRLAPCLSEVVDPAVVASLLVLRGVAAAREKEPDPGGYFVDARAVKGDLAWDGGAFNDADGAAIFQAVATRAPSRAPLTLLADPDVAVWVDGVRARTDGLAEGRHILQFRLGEGALSTLVVTIRGPDPVAVLFPRGLRATDLHWVFSAETSPASGRVLAEVWPDEQALAAVAANNVAKRWVVQPTRRFPRWLGPTLLAAGGAAAALGGVGAGLSFSRGGDAYQDWRNAPNKADYEAAAADYRAEQERLPVWLAAAAGGTGVALAGVWVEWGPGAK
jgi:hypothetical protein